MFALYPPDRRYSTLGPTALTHCDTVSLMQQFRRRLLLFIARLQHLIVIIQSVLVRPFNLIVHDELTEIEIVSVWNRGERHFAYTFNNIAGIQPVIEGELNG